MKGMRSFATVLVLTIGAMPVARAGDSVQLTLQGSIEPTCRIAVGTGSIDLGDLGKAGSISETFSLSCNAPFTIEIEADGGAFVAADPPPSSGPFESAIAYRARLSVPLSDGSRVDTGFCDSAELTAATTGGCRQASAADAAINQTATLDVEWTDPGATPRLAGEYSDRIEIRLRATL